MREQLSFIQSSCQSYDNGVESEARRIATALRVIFNDKGRNISLITHLGFHNQEMLSSSRGHGNWKDYVAIELNLNIPEPVRTIPILGDRFRTISIDDWWKNEPVFVYNGENYSRRLIVLSVTDKDGGAHVDKDQDLEPYYEVLIAGQYIESVSITGNLEYEGDPPFPQGVPQYAKNTHLALLRQFAHEALSSAIYNSWI